MPNATILIVDDEPLIGWSLASRLKDEGYRTLEAGTASEALSHYRDGVDLVLLDIGLPDANGLTVLKQIKEADPDTLVIMLTAHTGVQTAVEAMKHGAFHYANKPRYCGGAGNGIRDLPPQGRRWQWSQNARRERGRWEKLPGRHRNIRVAVKQPAAKSRKSTGVCDRAEWPVTCMKFSWRWGRGRSASASRRLSCQIQVRVQ